MPVVPPWEPRPRYHGVHGKLELAADMLFGLCVLIMTSIIVYAMLEIGERDRRLDAVLASCAQCYCNTGPRLLLPLFTR